VVVVFASRWWGCKIKMRAAAGPVANMCQLCSPKPCNGISINPLHKQVMHNYACCFTSVSHAIQQDILPEGRRMQQQRQSTLPTALRASPWCTP
jgi:hypothetical protein